MTITSPHNEQVKAVRRAREGNRHFWWEGERFFDEICRERFAVDTLVMTEEHVSAAMRLSSRPRITLVVSDRVMQALADTVTPQGIAGLCAVPSSRAADILSAEGHLFYLDGLQDPGNVGTIVRIADAFGLGGVLWHPQGVSPWNGKAVRASAGSILRTPVAALAPDELVACAGQGRTIFSLDPGSAGTESLGSVDIPPSSIFVFGQEGAGLRSPIPGARGLSIEMPGRAESLNVAVAAGIVAYRASAR